MTIGSSPGGLLIPRELMQRAAIPQRREPCCGVCRFSWRDPDGDLNCRRMPPVPFLDQVGEETFKVRTAFPLVAEGQWCGEWQAML